MFIATDNLLINTDQITSACYAPEKEAADPDDFNADENGKIPSTLRIYFPVSATEGDYGRPSVELTGEAADTVWTKLRAEAHAVLNMPSRKKVDYEARSRMRAERQWAW